MNSIHELDCQCKFLRAKSSENVKSNAILLNRFVFIGNGKCNFAKQSPILLNTNKRFLGIVNFIFLFIVYIEL